METNNAQLEKIEARLDRIEQMLVEQRQTMFNKPTLDLDEAVVYTRYSKGYLYRLTSEKKIPHCKKGRKIFFDRAKLDEWLKETPIKTQEEIKSEAQTYCVTNKPK